LGSNYHLFKEGVEPKWEDPVNRGGGKWVVVLPKGSRHTKLDDMWLWTVLACIGENFIREEEICGAVVSVRKNQDKISIWTRDTEEDATLDVGRRLKQVLELPDKVKIGYQTHQDAQRSRGYSKQRNQYEV